MGKLYLPNVHTIKSYTEHDEKNLRWRAWLGDAYEMACAGGVYHQKGDFFGTVEEAIAEACRRSSLLIARTEKSLARLKRFQEQVRSK